MSLPRILTGRRRLIFARLFANGLAQAGAALSIPLIIGWLGASGTGGAPDILGLTVALTGVTIMIMALRAYELIDAERLGQDYVTEVRLRLFDGVATGPGAGTRHGIAMTRMLNDLTSLKNWVGLGLVRIVVAALSLAGILAALALLDPRLAAVLAAPVAIGILIGALLAYPLRKRVKEVRRRRGRLAARLGEVTLAIELFRQFDLIAAERKRIHRLSRRLTEALERRMVVTGVLRALPDGVFPIIVILLLAMGGAAGSGVLAFSTILLAGLIITPLRNAARALEYRAAFQEAKRRLTPALGRATGDPAQGQETVVSRLPIPRPRAAAPVAITGSLTHLRADVDAWMRGGRRLALGHAPGADTPHQDRESADQDMERPDVALVSPDQPILRGSLKRNIVVRAGSAAPDEAMLADIMDICGLGDEATLPEGLDTKLREHGKGLPQHVAARIRLARALATAAPVIVVDDPILLFDREAQRVLTAIAERGTATLLVLWGEAFTPPSGWESRDLAA